MRHTSILRFRERRSTADRRNTSVLGFRARITDHVEVKEEEQLQAMRLAIELSKKAVEENLGGPFGAVILRDGEVVATGENRVTSSDDPTAHAEIVAIRSACEALGSHTLEGCEIFSSCEPCPMCLAAIEWAHLDRLTFGASREDAAEAGFDDARLYRELALPPARRTLSTRTILGDEARAAFKIWNDKDDRIPY
jgi:guanine deaminase